jgi:CubicO group peptidase (beta-lactamase class C family)
MLGCGLGALCIPPARAAERLDDAAFIRAANLAVDRAARDDGFSGQILVARGEQVLLRRAAGFADRERQIRNTPEMRFPIESVGKQFTAAAIMILVEDSRIALDDPISKFYPASPLAWKGVTLTHLLTHGSGISDPWVHHPEVQRRMETRELFHSAGELIQLSLREPLAFEPRKGIEYSNAGYALLGVVIESASGQTCADFLRSRIFEPLGMRDTGSGGTLPVNGYARGTNSGPLNLDELEGFGSIYSTLDDMHKWSLALEGDLILSRTSRNAMFTDYGFSYGLGWRLAPKFGQKLIWHTGNGWNLTTIFDRFPVEQLTIVSMSNDGTPTASTATLLIDGKVQTFPANAMRKLVEHVERLYFGREP